jgi:hypothetical protein
MADGHAFTRAQVSGDAVVGSCRLPARLLLLSSISAMALASGVQAQEAPASGSADVSEVVVTGSRIARRDFVSASPIVQQAYLGLAPEVSLPGAPEARLQAQAGPPPIPAFPLEGKGDRRERSGDRA